MFSVKCTYKKIKIFLVNISLFCTAVLYRSLKRVIELFYFQVSASDDDKDLNVMSYSIVSGNELGNFSINNKTGEMTLAKPLDRESTHQIILTVRAEDSTSNQTYFMPNTFISSKLFFPRCPVRIISCYYWRKPKLN